jgi:putative addiction module component (TIGR02574 family)
MSKAMPKIDKLTTEERLELIERLWDSLCDNPSAVPLTEAQRKELDRRLDDLERTGIVGIPWDEVVDQIRKRPK